MGRHRRAWVLWAAAALCLSSCGGTAAPRPDLLPPGDYKRTIQVGGLTRSCLVHVPAAVRPGKPAPLVLVFHGAATDAAFMVNYTDLNAKADAAGFVAAYPNGTSHGTLVMTWNAGGLSNSPDKPDDVAFTGKLLDDLAAVIDIDPKRVYATGYSNGAMLCYRLASELSGRIAAIAPVGGTMSVEDAPPQRPVPVMHFHGTEDILVPFGGPDGGKPRFVKFMSVEPTLAAWAKFDGCTGEPRTETLAAKDGDPTRVTRRDYGPGKDGAEVVLYTIEHGGHTWPGARIPMMFLGNTTHVISANDLMWEFFEKHPM